MTYTLESLATEQQELQLERFDYDFAWALGQEIRARASAENAPVAIEISHGLSPVFTTLLPGATIDNLDWTARKRAVAHRFHKSSLAVRLEAEAGGYDFNDRFRLPNDSFVASGGGFPLIMRGGTLIGTACVSGLPDTDDHRLIVEALRAVA
ncbi:MULTISPECIES: heme-degrading domain-containing protein [Rhizobium/Agrobacterium group]|uniref:heme-degrading domain-containing protein n=1 Tax=Rhizobium/Agrobacterium group TaxID=227290 RepID=UPI001ADABB0F|nr:MULTISPECIES: heme-degrading domain-containing protein [Rhizobium/Agrobacterium group]MBO9112472.1 heme-degrading domain-containing protein [Agrobacterium sp. S2/73]QXZ75981.1 heme-degrading domain-containing protein [Agrobacterium sp. S7/73]QYA17008.1 heme-degrading domain-containing protein [Rhizobium sp. AB2/73]UEQ85419.1 heme-degrading domain-containing protein [Rhizobium sp. AB2/73]